MKNCAFQLFPQLPPEIRACIWRHAIEPRIVPVTCWVGNQRAEAINTSRATHGAGWESDLAAVRRRRQNQKDPTTMTQLPLELYAVVLHKPPVLDVCRETRSIGLYEPMILTPGSSASYAWVNYNVDVIHLQDDQEPYTRFRNCGHLVRRLRICADPSDEYWFYNQSATLKSTFCQLAECFVVMGTDARIWDWKCYDYQKWFSCPPDNIHLIDEENGEQMTYGELLRLSDEDLKNWAISSIRYADES
ncbi:hypothetical protein BM221_002154 [Beauveria bassiana]|uniref:2EXR domain-containing protein n=1 Tax=Beauveria bassiana TaxID=176275 RepID=A0A2N6NXQ3_BEABA|nr:hypothetical protein BM221_002154 [Beauveria bassiana]